MLDKLPLELLDHVLDLLPPPSTFGGARERTDTLTACCLVSKRVYERSLPVLWREIRLDGLATFNLFVSRLETEPTGKFPVSTRTLRVNVRYGDEEGPGWEDDTESRVANQAVALLNYVPHLTQLYLAFDGELDLCQLASSLPSAFSLLLGSFSANISFRRPSIAPPRKG
jgi:hypothetical protein